MADDIEVQPKYLMIVDVIEQLTKIRDECGNIPVLIQENNDVGTGYAYPAWLNVLNIKFGKDGFNMESTKSKKKAVCFGIC